VLLLPPKVGEAGAVPPLARKLHQNLAPMPGEVQTVLLRGATLLATTTTTTVQRGVTMAAAAAVATTATAATMEETVDLVADLNV
jgi:hypothetical protein